MDRKDLKIQALKERIAELSTEHEERNANLRVELTLVSQERDALFERINQLEAPDAAVPEEGTTSPEED